MMELREIVRAYEESQTKGMKSALATVVKTTGSTYRRAGARLFIRENKWTTGAISGGCLENDVVEKALRQIESNTSLTAVFDMTSPDDELWGYSQGCNGVIHVLIEPIHDPQSARYFRFVSECLDFRHSGIIASIFRVDGELDVMVGSKLLAANGKIEEDILNPVITAALAEEAARALEEGTSRNKEIRLTEGTVEAFVEIIRPPISLLLFGAGADAIPLARLAKGLGWKTTVVDHRPGLLTKDRFPEADHLVLRRPEDLSLPLPADSRSAVVIMTHNLQHDLALIEQFLPRQLPYVGLLGPAKRRDLLMQRLRERGYVPPQRELGRLFSPIGLDIGTESPEEIALAIVAEIQAVLAQGGGGFMRNRKGPIHPPR